MAIAFDAASDTSALDLTDITSFTWAHTCTGTNRLLIVGVGIVDPTLSERTISSITYNTVPLTLIRADDNGTQTRSEIWRLVAPDTGTHDIVVTFGGNVTTAAAGGVSLTGVDQTTPNDANGGATGTSATEPSASVTTVANNAWVVDIVIGQGFNQVYTVDPSQTQRVNVPGGATWAGSAMSSEGPISPAGATTMNWTRSVDQNWALSAASFTPEPEPVEPGGPGQTMYVVRLRSY